MQFARIKPLIYLFLAISIFGCGLIRGRSPKSVQSTQAAKSRQEIAAEKTIEAMTESVQLEPSNKSVIRTVNENDSWNRAVTYWYEGDIEGTAEQMKDYVELSPENATAHNIIGLDY